MFCQRLYVYLLDTGAGGAIQFIFNVGAFSDVQQYIHIRVPSGTVFGGTAGKAHIFFPRISIFINCSISTERQQKIINGYGRTPPVRSGSHFRFLRLTPIEGEHASILGTAWRLPVTFTLNRDGYQNFGQIFNACVIYALDDLTKADDPQAWDILGEEGDGNYTHLNLVDEDHDGGTGRNRLFRYLILPLSAKNNDQAEETGKPRAFQIPERHYFRRLPRRLVHGSRYLFLL